MSENSYLQKTLEQVGLTEKEVGVYLSLLSLGSGTAYKIAEHCSVKKPTVYVILEELRKKGLVLKVPNAKKAVFVAKSITEYVTEKKEQLKQVEAIIPKLQSLGSHSQSNVYFFESISGIKQAMMYKFEAMKGKMFSSFYGNLSDCDGDILKIYSRWEKRAVENSISFRIIMAKKGSGEYYKETIRLAEETNQVRIHFLTQYEYPPNQSIEIGEDFVRIVNEQDQHATIIDDASTAIAMRQIFDIVWNTGRKT